MKELETDDIRSEFIGEAPAVRIRRYPVKPLESARGPLSKESLHSIQVWISGFATWDDQIGSPIRAGMLSKS